MIYFDTSFLTPLFRLEETSSYVERFVAELGAEELAISRWTMLEFASVLARDVRMGLLNQTQAHGAWTVLQRVVEESFLVLLPTEADYVLSVQYIQRYETGLRAGDALHLAIAAGHRAEVVYSLDRMMVRAGEILGLPVRRGIGEG